MMPSISNRNSLRSLQHSKQFNSVDIRSSAECDILAAAFKAERGSGATGDDSGRNELSCFQHRPHRLVAGSLPLPSASGGATCPPTVSALLVEHRDEVYARLAADLSNQGLSTFRATSAAGALKTFDARRPRLLIASVGLRDQSAWLLTAKLRLTEQAVAVWLYQPTSSSTDFEMAAFLNVTALFSYSGDLLELSSQLQNRLAAGIYHCT